MPLEFVTLEQAKLHLRTTGGDDDFDILWKIQAASGAVKNYLKDAADDFLDSSGQVIEDSNGELLVPDEVKMATLYLVGVFYRDRDGELLKDGDMNYLPRPVTALLYPLRTPTSQ